MKEIVGYPDTASRLVEVWEEGMVMMAGEGLSPIISCSPLPVTIHSLVDFFSVISGKKKKSVCRLWNKSSCLAAVSVSLRQALDDDFRERNKALCLYNPYACQVNQRDMPVQRLRSPKGSGTAMWA